VKAESSNLKGEREEGYMQRRFSLWTVIGVSALTAVVAAGILAWTGSIRGGGAQDVVVRGDSEALVHPTAWFQAQPSSFADLAERVQSAVVNISTSKKISSRRMITPFPRFGPQDPFDDFFNKFFEGMPREQTQRSLGSGFIIDKDGTILTNNHVVSQADEIEVRLSNNKKYKGKVVGVDEKTDIAVIRIKAGGDLPYVKLGNSEKMRPGDWVMAIGNPFGLEHTVTVGVVSAIGRAIGGGPYAKFIQTDASINPGNSGGPLFNTKGEVIGLNTMIYAAGQGIGFAIPIDLAKSLVPQLIEKGSVARGWLGIAIQEVTPELAKSFGLGDNETGALIAEVYADSPAAKGGLMRGDVVVELDGQKIEDPYDLSLEVGETKPGSEIRLGILRNGKRKDLKIRVGKQEGGQTTASVGGGDSPSVGKADALGIVARAVSAEDSVRSGTGDAAKGVAVARVEPDSAAEGAGIHSGDIITEVGGKPVGSVEDYRAATKDLKKGDLVRVLIRRQSASIYLAFRL